MEPLAGDRKCFRMINGVLVEMTVKDVLPPLRTNTEGLKKVGTELESQLLSKQKELDDWKVSHSDGRGCLLLAPGSLGTGWLTSIASWSTEEAQRSSRTISILDDALKGGVL